MDTFARRLAEMEIAFRKARLQPDAAAVAWAKPLCSGLNELAGYARARLLQDMRSKPMQDLPAQVHFISRSGMRAAVKMGGRILGEPDRCLDMAEGFARAVQAGFIDAYFFAAEMTATLATESGPIWTEDNVLFLRTAQVTGSRAELFQIERTRGCLTNLKPFPADTGTGDAGHPLFANLFTLPVGVARVSQMAGET